MKSGSKCMYCFSVSFAHCNHKALPSCGVYTLCLNVVVHVISWIYLKYDLHYMDAFRTKYSKNCLYGNYYTGILSSVLFQYESEAATGARKTELWLWKTESRRSGTGKEAGKAHVSKQVIFIPITFHTLLSNNVTPTQWTLSHDSMPCVSPALFRQQCKKIAAITCFISLKSHAPKDITSYYENA